MKLGTTRRKLIIATALALPVAPASAGGAEDWYRVLNGVSLIYVDAGSIERAGGKTQADVFIGSGTPMEGSDFYFLARHMEYDCGASTGRALSQRYYRRDHTLGKTVPAPEPYARTLPQSTAGGLVLRFVCTRRGGEKVSNPFDDYETLLKQP